VSAQSTVAPSIAPATVVTPPTSSTLPGTGIAWLQPGQSNTVTATFTNDAPVGLANLRLTLDAPDGWQVSPAQITQSTIGRERSLTGAWQVTPPANASGRAQVSVTAAYDGNGQPGTTSSTGDFQVGPLTTPHGTAWLSDVDPIETQNDWSTWYRDRNYYGGPLTIHGTTYAKGLWVNAGASADYYLGGNCARLTADLGLDDSDRSTGSVTYQVWTDGTKVYDSGVVTNSTPTIHLAADLTGARVVRIVVTDAGDGINYDNADFGGAQLTCNP
jgi:alpha-galactosidase